MMEETEFQKFKIDFNDCYDEERGCLKASLLDDLIKSTENDNIKLRLAEEFPPGTTFNAFGKMAFGKNV